MTNAQVIRNFLNGEAGKSTNLHKQGNKLVNYDTTIAEWFNGSLLVNDTQYSRSTRKIQSELKRQLDPHGFPVVYLKDFPIGIRDLGLSYLLKQKLEKQA